MSASRVLELERNVAGALVEVEVAVSGRIPQAEKVIVCGASLTAEGVEALATLLTIERERDRAHKHRGLAGGIGAAQHEAAVHEVELVVVEEPVVLQDETRRTPAWGPPW